MNGCLVLDLTRLTAGAYTTRLLADAGARVVKVEKPGSGDTLRTIAPAVFEGLCHGKESITLNFKAETGRNMLLELAEAADVVVENFRPGVTDRLRISFSDLRDINPRLVMCSITGYGQTGPYRDSPGHDLNYLGVSGALGLLNGAANPTEYESSIAVSDFFGAYSAAFAISTALLQAQQTGEGAWLDISITDAVASIVTRYLAEYQATNGSVGVAGWPGYGVFETSDNELLTLGCIENVFWRNLLESLPHDHPLQDFGDDTVRHAQKDRVDEMLAELFCKGTLEYWLTHLASYDVPVAPVNDLDSLPGDIQMQTRGLVHQDDTRPVRVLPPFRLNDHLTDKSPAPALGQHNASVWNAMGYTETQLAQLHRDQVL